MMEECVLVVDAGGNLAGIVEAAFADKGVRICGCDSTISALEKIVEDAVAVTIINSEEDPSPLLKALEQRAFLTLPVLFDGNTVPVVSAPTEWNRHPLCCMPWQTDLLFRMIVHGIFRYRLNIALQNVACERLVSLMESMEERNAFSVGHCGRVGRYADMIAEKLDLPAGTRQQIRLGSLLHDCGKTTIPRTFSGYGLPSDGAFAEVKMHPEWGVELLLPSRPEEVVRNIIMYHHERFDGNGYPAGISGRDIPLEARIVAVADVYDALTTQGSYRKPYSKGRALRMVNSMKGSILDNELVEAFSDIISATDGICSEECYACHTGDTVSWRVT